MFKSVFYCDIVGTYDYDKRVASENTRKIQLLKFVNTLDKLCEISNEEEMGFGFISSNPLEDVLACIKEFLPFIRASKHIKIGSSFSEMHKIVLSQPRNSEKTIGKKIHKCNTGKIFQITSDIADISHDDLDNFHAILHKVYFADDVVQQHKLLRLILPNINNKIELIDFIPGSNVECKNLYGSHLKGLCGTIEAIELCIQKDLANKKLKKDDVESPF